MSTQIFLSSVAMSNKKHQEHSNRQSHQDKPGKVASVRNYSWREQRGADRTAPLSKEDYQKKASVEAPRLAVVA